MTISVVDKTGLEDMARRNLEHLRRIEMPTGPWLNDEQRSATHLVGRALDLFEQSLELAGSKDNVQ